MMGIESMKLLLRNIYNAGVESVKPGSLIRSVLKVHENILEINNNKYDLTVGKCFILGFGKAVLAIAKEAETILHSHVTGGVVIVPHGSIIDQCQFVEVYQGAKNNLPDKDCVLATSRLVNLVKNLSKDDLVFCLISGGGSALLTMPKETISLDEKLLITKLLGNRGANIRELNYVRKHLSCVKGGQLAEIIFPARTVSLILSDIVGDPIDLIASGPTSESISSLNASDIISKYGLTDEIPNNVHSLLLKPPIVNKNVFSSVDNFIIGNNITALKQMSKMAKANNFESVIISSRVEGNVETLSQLYWRMTKVLCETNLNLNALEELKDIVTALGGHSATATEIYNVVGKKRICLLAGGEPTVHVTGDGKGGRNQELALRFSSLAEKEPLPERVNTVFLAAGSDGIDGPTDAAGAFAYPGQTKAAIAKGLDPIHFISNNNSYNFFKNFNHGMDHIISGHTGTNVMDFHVLAFECS